MSLRGTEASPSCRRGFLVYSYLVQLSLGNLGTWVVSVAMFNRFLKRFRNQSGRKRSAHFISFERGVLYSEIKQCVIFVSEKDK